MGAPLGQGAGRRLEAGTQAELGLNMDVLRIFWAQRTLILARRGESLPGGLVSIVWTNEESGLA